MPTSNLTHLFIVAVNSIGCKKADMSGSPPVSLLIQSRNEANLLQSGSFRLLYSNDKNKTGCFGFMSSKTCRSKNWHEIVSICSQPLHIIPWALWFSSIMVNANAYHSFFKNISFTALWRSWRPWAIKYLLVQSHDMFTASGLEALPVMMKSFLYIQTLENIHNIFYHSIVDYQWQTI